MSSETYPPWRAYVIPYQYALEVRVRSLEAVVGESEAELWNSVAPDYLIYASYLDRAVNREWPAN